MNATNRATRISKLHTLLKKAYKPIVPVDNRPLIEHLLYACLLENSPYELADEALAKLEQDYFDWNEVRVTTITELAEVLGRLPDATAAAVRLKKNLHGLFEGFYTFDIEELRKQNLGKALQRFERLPAMTPFVLDYVTQHGLGGHAIPLDSAALRFFWFTDIIGEGELNGGRVPGLERAIPKNKGVEFASLLHQAAVAINMDPNDPVARSIALQLNPALDQQLTKLRERRREDKAAQKERDAEEKLDESASSSPKSKPAKIGKTAKEPSNLSVKSPPEVVTKPAKESADKGQKPKAEKQQDAPVATKAARSKESISSEKKAKEKGHSGAEKETVNSEKSLTSSKSSGKSGTKKTPPAKQEEDSKTKTSAVTPKKKTATKKSAPLPAEEPPAKPAAKKKAASSKSAPAKPSNKKISKKKPR